MGNRIDVLVVVVLILSNRLRRRKEDLYRDEADEDFVCYLCVVKMGQDFRMVAKLVSQLCVAFTGSR